MVTRTLPRDGICDRETPKGFFIIQLGDRGVTLDFVEIGLVSEKGEQLLIF